MPSDYVCKTGDSDRAFEQQLSYTDGTYPDLTGATVQFLMRSLTTAQPVTMANQVTIVSPTIGVVQYPFAATDTATPGNYMANWVVDFPTGTQDTFPADGYLWVEIQPDLTLEQQQLVSLPDVKEYLGADHNQHDRDHELVAMIEAALPIVELKCGPIIPKVYDEKYDGGQNLISLRNRPSTGFGTTPILNLIGASEFRGPVEFALPQVQNPVFGTIYSCELDIRLGTVTRRTAGGGVIAFMPGRNTVHFVYRSGQAIVPPNVRMATLEAIRIAYWTSQPAGRGRLAVADVDNSASRIPYGFGPSLMRLLEPTRKFVSFA